MGFFQLSLSINNFSNYPRKVSNNLNKIHGKCEKCLILDILFRSFGFIGFIALKDFEIIWLSNLLTLTIPDYSRNVPCALSLISTFLHIICLQILNICRPPSITANCICFELFLTDSYIIIRHDPGDYIITIVLT